MGADHVNAFLSYLATAEDVSSTTQNQALAAILFLYRAVLEDPLRGSMTSCVRGAAFICRWF